MTARRTPSGRDEYHEVMLGCRRVGKGGRKGKTEKKIPHSLRPADYLVRTGGMLKKWECGKSSQVEGLVKNKKRVIGGL